jgi:hypothetical protein
MDRQPLPTQEEEALSDYLGSQEGSGDGSVHRVPRQQEGGAAAPQVLSPPGAQLNPDPPSGNLASLIVSDSATIECCRQGKVLAGATHRPNSFQIVSLFEITLSGFSSARGNLHRSSTGAVSEASSSAAAAEAAGEEEFVEKQLSTLLADFGGLRSLKARQQLDKVLRLREEMERRLISFFTLDSDYWDFCSADVVRGRRIAIAAQFAVSVWLVSLMLLLDSTTTFSFGVILLANIFGVAQIFFPRMGLFRQTGRRLAITDFGIVYFQCLCLISAQGTMDLNDMTRKFMFLVLLEGVIVSEVAAAVPWIISSGLFLVATIVAMGLQWDQVKQYPLEVIFVVPLITILLYSREMRYRYAYLDQVLPNVEPNIAVL